MTAFLKFQNEQHVSFSVNKWWIKPKINMDTCSREWINNCNWNKNGLNVIFMVVLSQEFKRISMCEVAKEIWDNLEVMREEANIV